MAAQSPGGDRLRLAAPAPCRLAGEALQDAADAIMRRRIGGAPLGAPGKVGGDGQRIGGHRLVAVVSSPCRPPARIYCRRI